MIWIIGAGYMAKEYCKVLQALDVPFRVIGRGEQSAKQFTADTGIEAMTGGIENSLNMESTLPSHAIVCTPVETLSSVVISLLQAGVKKILLEKPGALSVSELDNMISLAKQSTASVMIGYNRRFYQATLAAETMIKQDGELIAVNFEITEWSHRIKDEACNDQVKSKWMLSNTSHVIDLVFFMAGFPEQFSSYTAGGLDWHASASRFVGAGITTRGAVLSYYGYWDGPGRWSTEFTTNKRKYILRPMETLSIQNIGSVEIVAAEDVDYSLDEQFKPGLYLQTKAFLNGDHSRLCSLPAQKQAFMFYQTMADYKTE